jgi:hypothetical protein
MITGGVIKNVTCKYKPICKFAKYGRLCNIKDCAYYSKGVLKLNSEYKGDNK